MVRLGSLIERVKGIIDVGEFHDQYRSSVHLSVSWHKKCILWIMNQLAELSEYLNIQDDYGNTPLLYALQLDCPNDTIIRCIERGADVNCSNFSGCSPLFYALNFHRDEEVIIKILDSGASLDAKDESDMTPLMAATMLNSPKEIVLRILHETSDINCIDQFGKTALIYALQLGNKDIICKMIDRGANTQYVDEEGNTILHKVSGSAWAGISSLIFTHGISFDRRNKNGETPLFLAAKHFDVDKVQTLLELGCEPNAADMKKRTPLHVASHADIISLLIYYGGDLKAKDSFGCTPLDLKLINFDQLSAECITKHIFLLSEEDILKYLESDERLRISTFDDSLKQFKKELDELKVCKITENLTFHQFCTRKKTVKSNILHVSKSEYLYTHDDMREKFPIFFDIIFLKMDRNETEKKRYDLIKSMSQISIKTYSNLNNEGGEELNYDCFEYVVRYLTREEVFNLFLASL